MAVNFVFNTNILPFWSSILRRGWSKQLARIHSTVRFSRQAQSLLYLIFLNHMLFLSGYSFPLWSHLFHSCFHPGHTFWKVLRLLQIVCILLSLLCTWGNWGSEWWKIVNITSVVKCRCGVQIGVTVASKSIIFPQRCSFSAQHMFYPDLSLPLVLSPSFPTPNLPVF